MSEKSKTFFDKYGAGLAFLGILILGALITWFTNGAKYEWIEGQEVMVKAGSTLQAILTMLGTLVIAWLVAKRVSS